MKYNTLAALLFVGGLSTMDVWAADRVEAQAGKGSINTDCVQQNVDTADDMNFAQAIVECDQGATVLYDAESRRSFLKRRNLPEKAYEKRAESLGEAITIEHLLDGNNVSRDGVVHVPGAAFIIREPYLINAPGRALPALHRQMATYCPLGWAKDREWSAPAGSEYFLHFEFTCSSKE